MKIKIIILILLLVACSKGSIEKWEPKNIIGFRLSLIDQKRVELLLPKLGQLMKEQHHCGIGK